MEIHAAFERLYASLGPNEIRAEEPMSLHTTFRVGGPADVFLLPRTAGDVAEAVKICRAEGVPLLVIGNGSNLLVRDGGIRGAVMMLGGQISGIAFEGAVMSAGAGASLSAAAAEAQRQGLAGMEFASGIPGSVGGAAAMNAGAYGGEMKDIVQAVDAVTPAGEIVTLQNIDMAYGYRHSRALSEGLIITKVRFGLHHGDAAEIQARMDDFNAQRRQKQPLEMPSAGSFFKRPPGYFAGKLISEAGLKGFRVGGAMVSEKHQGFVVNAGGATASDILALAEAVKAKVKESFGVELEMEVRTVGED